MANTVSEYNGSGKTNTVLATSARRKGEEKGKPRTPQPPHPKRIPNTVRQTRYRLPETSKAACTFGNTASEYASNGKTNTVRATAAQSPLPRERVRERAKPRNRPPV